MENWQVHANRSSYLIGSLLHPGHHGMQHLPAAMACVWTLGMASHGDLLCPGTGVTSGYGDRHLNLKQRLVSLARPTRIVQGACMNVGGLKEHVALLDTETRHRIIRGFQVRLHGHGEKIRTPFPKEERI